MACSLTNQNRGGRTGAGYWRPDSVPGVNVIAAG